MTLHHASNWFTVWCSNINHLQTNHAVNKFTPTLPAPRFWEDSPKGLWMREVQKYERGYRSASGDKVTANSFIQPVSILCISFFTSGLMWNLHLLKTKKHLLQPSRYVTLYSNNNANDTISTISFCFICCIVIHLDLNHSAVLLFDGDVF